MGFPTKNDHFGVFWGYNHLRKHPYVLYFLVSTESIHSSLLFVPTNHYLGLHQLNCANVFHEFVDGDLESVMELW